MTPVENCFILNAPGGISGVEQYAQEMQNFINSIHDTLVNTGLKNVPQINNYDDLDAYLNNNYTNNNTAIDAAFDIAMRDAGIPQSTDDAIRACIKIVYG